MTSKHDSSPLTEDKEADKAHANDVAT